MKSKKTEKMYEEDFFEGIFAHAVGNFSKKDLIESKKWFYSWLFFIKRNIPLIVTSRSRVLEVGCSIGGFASLLKDEGFKKIYASDISKLAVKKAKKINPDIHFSSFDLEKGIPLSGTFDYIFAFEVVEHINNPEKAIRNTFKKLKKNGFMVLSTPPPYKRFIETPTHVSVKGKKEWVKIIKKSGFKTVTAKQVLFIPVLWRYSKYLNFAFPFAFDIPFLKLNTTIFYFAQKK